jgi:DNA-binding response OmpR family regulator/signal transduction histidine kinase
VDGGTDLAGTLRGTGAGAGGRPRVLVVEDERLMAATLRDVLESEGCEVVIAASGADALSRMESLAVDVLLLDVMLPGMDGYEVCRRIRTQETGGHLPVVMLSALGEMAARVKGLRAGADDYLGKPFHTAELLARVKVALRMERLRRDLMGRSVELARANAMQEMRARQLETVRRVSEEIARELDLTQLLNLILERTMAVVRAGAGAVWVWDDKTELLVPMTWRGYDDSIGGLRIRVRSEVVEASSADLLAWLGEFRVMAEVVEILAHRGRVVGVLTLSRNGCGGAFSREDRELVGLLGGTVASAIANAMFHGRVVRRGEEVSTLLRVGRSVMSEGSLQQVVERIVGLTAEVSGCEQVQVAVVDETGGVLRVLAQRGAWSTQGGEVLPIRGTLAGLVVETGAVVFSPDVGTDERNSRREADSQCGMVTYLGVPIRGRAKVLGVLALTTREPRQYAEAEVTFLARLSDDVAMSVEKAGLYEELDRAYQTQRRMHEELVRSEKLRALGEMAAGVAHDLNNTLTVVLGQGETVRRWTSEPGVKEAASLLIRAAQDGAEVVRRLQTFARQGPMQERVGCHLADLVRDALDMTRGRWNDEAERRGRTIRPEVRMLGVPEVLGSPAEIREALMNLILNAVDAMPGGGVLRFTGVAVTDGEGRRWVELVVTDTGVGMPEEVRRRIFDPFFTTKGLQGTGLGLSVVYGIMQRHQGSIVVASARGRGTQFTLRFPVGQGAPAHSTVAARVIVPRRLLVVDDNAGVRRVMASLLRSAGHSVLEASRGAAGLALLAAHPVDLVCTDMGMPEMTGLEFARRVKAEHDGVPIVLLTGWGKDAVQSGKAEVVDGVLAKPVNMSVLLQTIAGLTEVGARRDQG